MLPVGPKPIMEHLLEWLKKWGIGEVVVSTGYLGKMIQEYFGDGSEWGAKIAYATSSRPLGTAGQLKAAESKIRGRFVCLYGDQLFDFDLSKAIAFHERKGGSATMVLMKYSTELRYGFMETDKDGRLLEWKEKPTISGFINIGCYIMEKEFLKYLKPGRVYEMNDAFKEAKSAGAQIYAVKVEGTFMDIGDRKSFKDANDLYTRNMPKGDIQARK
jgi:mannose-1-phosphate guanylyltransferase